MSDTLKSYIQDNLLRGMYVTAEESSLDSPLQFVLWHAWQQYQRNERSNHLAVMDAVTGEN